MLGYLISPIAQIQDIDGKPISGAQLFVYLADTTTAAPTFYDFEGHRNTFPVVADLLGNCTIIADSANTYDLEIRNPDGTLLMGKKNLSVSFAGEDGRQTFSPGFGIGFSTVGNTTEINVDTDLIATQEDLNGKQDRLTPGANISIADNRISVTGRKEVIAQYPIRMNRGTDTVKFYLDQDFIDNISDANVVAGTDIKIEADQDGNKVVSIDTDGVATGEGNFIAGKGTSITGDYNTVSGGDNTVNGSSCSCSGLGNSVDGTGAVCGGYNNNIEGNHALAVGEGLLIQNNHNSAVGKWNTGVDALFAVGMGTDSTHRADAFRVDPDGKVFVTYNGQMVQVVPSTPVSSLYANESVTFESRNYTNERINLAVTVPAGKMFVGTITIAGYEADDLLTFVGLSCPGFPLSDFNLGVARGGVKWNTFTLPCRHDNTQGNTAVQVYFNLNGNPNAHTADVIVNGTLL